MAGQDQGDALRLRTQIIVKPHLAAEEHVRLGLCGVLEKLAGSSTSDGYFFDVLRQISDDLNGVRVQLFSNESCEIVEAHGLGE